MQKYKLADTAITRMIFWTQTDLVALFYNSSVVSNGLWDVKSRSLCRYFNPSHQPLLLSSAWWSMNPHPLYLPGRWTVWLRFSPHTPPWCAHTVTSAWNDCPWLVPWMGFYSSFNSQLQSLLLCLSSSFPKGPQHFALASMEAMVIFFITVCMSYLQGDCKFLKGEMESPYLSP